MPMKEPVEEEEGGEDADVGEAPPTEESVPEQVPVPPVTLLVVAGIWAGGPGDQLAGQGPATSLRAWGKAPAI